MYIASFPSIRGTPHESLKRMNTAGELNNLADFQYFLGNRTEDEMLPRAEEFYTIPIWQERASYLTTFWVIVRH